MAQQAIATILFPISGHPFPVAGASLLWNWTVFAQNVFGERVPRISPV